MALSLPSMEPNYRRCISCRQVAPKSSLWRVVRLHPCHTVQLDSGMGRSAYLCPTVDCLQIAQKKNRLGRSLKVSIPESIFDILWQRLSIADSIDLEATVKASIPVASHLSSTEARLSSSDV